MLFKAHLKTADALKCFQSTIKTTVALIEDSTGEYEVYFESSQLENLPLWLQKICEEIPQEIDWAKQWKDFSPHYKNGFLSLDLSAYGTKTTLNLKPGPGFGDLSHSTTFLMLELMKRNLSTLRTGSVIDIGSGSGILALASALLGSKHVIGVDIDLDANYHAKENADLNHLSHVLFIHPDQFHSIVKPPQTILINMLLHEQKSALQSLKIDFKQMKLFLSSGVLKQQQEEYIQFLKEMSLVPKKIVEKEGWLGICAKPIV